MPLREVKPLNAEQWEQLTTALRNGPTLENQKFIDKALERVKELEEIKE